MENTKHQNLIRFFQLITFIKFVTLCLEFRYSNNIKTKITSSMSTGNVILKKKKRRKEKKNTKFRNVFYKGGILLSYNVLHSLLHVGIQLFIKQHV